MPLKKSVRTIVRRAATPIATLRELGDRRTHVYFLHIGKTAGTQIIHVIEQVNSGNAAYFLIAPGHGRKLLTLPDAAPYFFSIRRPESRFRSAFYSRKRKGLPRHPVEWTPDEERAFTRFEHANDLAEALFAEGDDGHQAFLAMKSISHVSMNQADWFDRSGYFLERRPPIWIVRQEAFDADLAVLLDRLGHEGGVEITRDPASAHINSYKGIPPLSEKARENLRAWYAQDYELYRQCEAWIEANT